MHMRTCIQCTQWQYNQRTKKLRTNWIFKFTVLGDVKDRGYTQNEPIVQLNLEGLYSPENVFARHSTYDKYAGKLNSNLLYVCVTKKRGRVVEHRVVLLSSMWYNGELS